MRAIVHEAFGPPRDVLALREVDEPVPGPDEALVRVRAAAVARGDWLIARGLPYIARPAYGLLRPRQSVAGLELAGVVERVGADVADVAPGDAVFGWAQGALAERVAVPSGQLVPKPERISFEQAAAIPVSGFAALQALRDAGEVSRGHHVLILGASGAVGSFAVQIARALGAVVTGVASTRNLDLVRRLGADEVLDYTRASIADAGRRFDVIVDIAGNRPLGELRRALAPDGTLVIVGGSGGRATMGFGRTIRAALLSPFVRQRLRGLISSPRREDLAALAELVAAGRLDPVVGRTFPLADAPRAIEAVGGGGGHGKAVVVVPAGAPVGAGA